MSHCAAAVIKKKLQSGAPAFHRHFNSTLQFWVFRGASDDASLWQPLGGGIGGLKIAVYSLQFTACRLQVAIHNSRGDSCLLNMTKKTRFEIGVISIGDVAPVPPESGQRIGSDRFRFWFGVWCLPFSVWWSVWRGSRLSSIGFLDWFASIRTLSNTRQPVYRRPTWLTRLTWSITEWFCIQAEDRLPRRLCG